MASRTRMVFRNPSLRLHAFGVLGDCKKHVPSCLKILKLWGYYEEGESNEQFLKRTSLEMKDDCKRKKFPVMI